MTDDRDVTKRRLKWLLGFIVLVVVISKLGGGGGTTPTGTTSAGPAAVTDPAAEAREAKRAKYETAKTSATLTLNSWHKDGFDNVMMVDVTIANGVETPLKDIELTCISSAPSGTKIDRNVRTIYEIVKTKRRFRDFNMGFIAPQATTTSCEITDFAFVE
jgi:hypothetical protein